MKNFCVIGSNYGDEGKGLMTDYLSRSSTTNAVFRFNGGAQAGHTVSTENGVKHVFSTYGSGTFAGKKTILTSDVVLNPLAALKEQLFLRQNFPALHLSKIDVSVDSPITTPFDILINQATEKRRGLNKFGSCGLGINETVERHLASPEMSRVLKTDNCDIAINWITDVWLPSRLQKLKFEAADIAELQDYTVDLGKMYRAKMQQAFDQVFNITNNIHTGSAVYEGAQGLALDEELGTFPYVTRSNTGVRNALNSIVQNSTEKEIEVVYCTRTYLTRHGAGPLDLENSDEYVLCGNKVVDTTNIPNPWQDSLRFAPLNLFELQQRIRADLKRNRDIIRAHNLVIKPVIALTCMDQSSHVMLVENEGEQAFKTPVKEIPELLRDFHGLTVKYESYGPSANNIIKINENTATSY